MVYQGSKARYAKYIVPILQDYIDKNNVTTYIDVCCGGCNIIDKIVCDRKIAVDNNPYLIDLFKYGQTGQCEFPQTVTKEEWDRVKKNPDDCPWLTGMYAFFCSYSARGFAGGFCCNPSYGDGQYQSRKKNFLKQIPNLQDVEFYCADIFSSPQYNIMNSLIYIDPPYKNTKKYDSSKNFDYDKFWQLARELSINNIVLISEQQAPDDFESIWSLDVTRNTFGKGGHIQVTENLFKLKV